MDFKQFYKDIIFDIDNSMNTLYTAKQGDTKSRGFYVTITQNKIVVPVSNQSMTFFVVKPDGTRIFQDAVVDGVKFRIDLTNQMFAVEGKVQCELTLRGSDGESISSKTFKMLVDKQLENGSIVSKDERGMLDKAIDDVTGIVATEGNRVVTEQARVTAEGKRVTVESARVTEEGKRKTNEAARVTAETAREINYTNKIDAFVVETERVEAIYPARLASVEEDLATHKKDIMPRQVKDLKSNKRYKIGLQLSTEGNPQIIYEEVI